MKNFLIMILMTFCIICCFGGGAFIGLLFCLIFGIEGYICKIIVVISLFFFSFLGFYLTEKFNKFF